MTRILGFVTAALAIVLGSAFIWARAYLARPMPIDSEPQVMVVAPGASLRTVAAELERRGWLSSPEVLVQYARLRGLADNIKAGEYELEQGTSPMGFMEQLVEGRVILHSLTVIEGWTFRQMREQLHAHPDVTQTLGELSDAEVMTRLGREGEHPEGLFFPDTYRFPGGTTDERLLAQALQLMDKQLAAAWEARHVGLPLDSPYQALILASIVEKETALDSERAKIAGVFVKRLRRGMRLQTDPTVIYGIGAAFDGDIRRQDLKRDNPYNTYTRAGLPPTPIALAGASSLEAVMHPAESEALYFVATGEPDGSHYFSATLEEHNRAVRRYLTRIRQKP